MKAKKKTLEVRRLVTAIKLSSLAYAGVLAGILSPMAYAGPEGGVVTGGEGTIDVDGSTTTIDQVTDLLSIDWESFNLSPEELVKFLQPDSSSIVLNRILGQDPTTIHGSIEANGHVILVNPRGVLFTETATVNVGAITASGLDMNPEDFMNGDFIFQGEDGSSGIVVNRGVINASSALLVGKQVTNASSGLISAELVSLAAADEALLTFDADGLIGLKITKEVMENDLGVDSAVLNEGAIEGAQVLMEASVSGDLFTAAVNNEGTIKAKGIDTSGGKIRLFGSGSGVANSGTLDASGIAGGEIVLEGDTAEHTGQISVTGNSGNGGYVAVLGDEVFLAGDIDARGTDSGGEVLIGGDYQGVNPEIRNAEFTTVTSEANINASGIGNAKGGKVIVWSDITTEFGGTILAESGAAGGDGGLVETSGKQYLHLDEEDMFVSTLSHGDGETGNWLLDPGWMEIADDPCVTNNCVSVSAVVSALANNNIEISVTDANNGSGPGGPVTPSGGDFSDGILVADSIAWTTAHTLTLTSYSGVKIDNGVTVSAVNGGLTVNAGGSFTNEGSITVSDFSLSVGGTDDNTINELGDITVTNSGTVVANSGDDLFTLSDSADSLIVNGTKSFSIDAISFSGVEKVDLGDGTDSVTGADGVNWELTGTDYQAKNSGITFSNVENLTATNAALVGTTNADAFILQADGNVKAYELTVSGMSSVNGNGDSDSLDASAYSDGLALTGAVNQVTAESGTLTFDGIASAVTATLTGSSGVDAFEITGNNALDVADISFSGLSTVNAGSGTDSVAALGVVTLTGVDNEASTSLIDFSGIDSVTGGSLEGSANADTFVVVSNTNVTANSISFTGFSGDIDAKDGADSVTGADGVNWELTGTDYQAKNSGITFSNVENLTATNAGLVGTTNADAFILQADGNVKAYELTVSGMSSVNGNGDSDSLDASAYSDGLALTGAVNQVTAESGTLTFDGIVSAVTATLTGSSGVDAFEITGNSALDVADISFSGLSTVNAGSGTDSVVALGVVTLTGVDNEASTSLIDFSGIDSVSGGSLEGSANADTFVVVSNTNVTANSISFTGFSGDIDAKDGADSVTGADGVNWELTGTDYQAKNSGITFSNVENLTATNAALVGTTNADAFILQADGNVKAYELTVSGMSSVNGNGDSDSLDASAYSDGLALTGAVNQVTAESGTLTFDGIASAVTATLTGSSGVDAFEITGNNALDVADISFSGLSTVNAGSGTDSVAALGVVTLTGVDNEASTSLIDFSGIDSVTGGSLEGSANADTFVVVSNTNVTANSISFTGFSGDIDAKDGADSVTGADGVNWELTGTDYQAKNSGITFSNVENLTATNAGLVGTTNADAFILQADGNVKAYELTVSGMSSVNGNGDSDSLDASAYSDGLALTGAVNQVTAESGTLTFDGIVSAVTATLTGSSGVDAFEITGNSALDVADISFSGLSTVNAGSGTDSVAALGVVTLTGVDNEASTSLIDFSGIDSVTGGSLEGSANADTFVVVSNTNVTANSISFTGFSGDIDAKDGADSVTGADGANWILTGTSKQASNSNITFSNVESLTAVNANLLGTASVDAFTLQSNGDVAVYDLTVSGMSVVDGQGGDDSLNASAYSDGLTLTGTNNQVAAGSLTFDGIVSAVTAALTGTDNADSFVVDGSNAASSYGIAFSGLSTINALDGSDSVIGADGANWTLTGTSKQASNSSITFSNVESLTAVNANLLGTASVDAFTLQSNGDVAVYDLTVSGMSAVDGQGGDDSLNASAYSDGLTLTGTNNQVAAGSLTFDGIVSAVTAALTGTDNADSFVVDGSNAASSYGIAFSGLSTINALDGSDSVIGADGANWILTGTSKQASNSSITFSNVESLTAVNANLLGTASVDAFTLQSNGDVAVYDLTVSGMSAVDGQGGDDSLNASAYSDGLALTGAVNQVTAESGTLTFDGIVSAVTATLTGSSGIDAFEITGNSALDVADISFSGLSTVNAGSGTDSVVALGVVTLTGVDNEASTSLIDFSGIDSISGGSLEGSGNSDTFVVTGLNALTANKIAFSSISSVDAKGGSDSVTGADGANWILTGTSKQASNSSITFSNVESLTAVNANLLGTSGTDAFVLQSGGDVAVYDLTVSGMSAVDGNGGDDSLNASAYSDGLALTGAVNQVTAESGTLTFDGIASAVTATLTGSSGVDAFEITGNNALDVADISFSGLSTVNAGSGTDSVVALGVVTLTGVDNEASTSLIDFSGIDSVTGGSLEGSANADTFVVVSNTNVTANSISFTGFSGDIDAKDGADSVTGADGANWILTGTSKQASNSNITFSNVESLTAVNANLLGTASVDAFTLQSNGDVAVYDLTVSGMSVVDGQGGDDSLNASAYSDGLTLTGTNNQVAAGSLTFDGIVSAVTAALTGTDNADSFVVDGSNAASSYGIAFSGLSTINALDGSDSVIGADGANWILTGTSKQASNSSITFSNVESLTAVNANLLGTSGTDAFVLQSGGDVAVYDLTVSGMSAVDGQGGDDSLNASAYSDGLTLTGTNNQVAAGSLTFDGIVSAVTAALTGTDNADSFVVDGSNAASSYGIAFSGLSTINALDGSDSVIGADGANWTLTGTSKQASNSSITFSNVESLTAVNANLLGTASVDAFTLQSNGDVAVYDLTVSGMSAVDGQGGDDSLNASAYSDGLALTGAVNQVTAESGTLTFDGIVSAVTATLTGSSGIDAFEITGNSALDVADISFSGLSTVNAGSGTDSVVALGVVTLTGVDNEASTSLIDFSGIDSISGGSLEGSGNSDTFVVTGLNALTANKIAFSSISSVDAKGGSDSVTGADGANWILTGTSKQASNSSITFSNVESLTAVNANLLGTSGTDAFVLQSGGDVAVYDLTVSGMSAVNGNGDSDSLDASAYSDGLALTGAVNQVTAESGTLTFDGIASAVTATLTGSSGVDAFEITGNNALDVADISFSGLSTVNAGSGTDSVVALGVVTLTGVDNEASTSLIDFSGIDSVTGGSLEGSANADTFVVVSNTNVTANSISFTGFSGDIDAKDGADSVTGADGANWILTGTSKQASNSNITFSNVESLTAVNANLLGTASVDAFTLQSNGDVAVYDLTVSGMSVVDGQGGDDSLNASAYSDGLTLTGTNNQVAAGSLTFDGIVSAVTAALTGTDNADSFVVDGSNAASSYGIAFSGLSTINALDGSDSVIGADGANWTLTGTSKQASNSSITFSNVESLTAVNANLLGTASVDAFTLQSNGDVAVYDLTVSGMSAVDGQGGDDSLNASAYSDGLTLTGTNNQVAAGSLTFDGIVSAVTAALTGTDNADSFVVDGSNAASSYGIAFSGLSTINALDGSDSVIGADGANWTLTGTSKQASNSSITFSNVESLTAVNANLLGTASVDAFTLQSNGDVAVYDLTVSGMSAVDGQGGDDSLNASAYSDGLTLTGTNNQVAAGSLTFDGIVSAVTAALTGTDNADSFVVDGSNAASSYGIAFSGLSTINALDGSDSVIGADGANWTLTGTSKQASNSSITFSNVESLTAVNANLLGTASVDAFTLQSNGDVAVYDLTVSGMSAVDGQGGDDSLNASAYSDGLTLTGTNNQVAAGSLTFDGIVSAVTAALTGTDNADSFVVDGSNAASSYGIAFSGLSTINALDGSDSVIGADGANWTLTGTSKQASNSSITFSNVESLTAVNANLLGTASVDAFTLQSNGDVAVYDLTVSGMSAVDGQGGDDSLNASAYSDGLTLTGTNNQVAAGSLTFDGIVSAVTAALTGTDNADSFVVDGSNAASSYGIAFSGLSTINALDGSDSVIGADGANWTLTGTSKQASNSSITFSNVESLTAVNANLLGTASVDAFTLQSNGDVAVYDLTVSGMSAVDGQGGDDSLNASAYSDGLALTGAVNQVTAESGTLTFDGIVSAVTATLTGSSGIDAFEITGNSALDVADISFSGLSTVNAGSGTDSVVALGVVTLTGVDNEASTSLIDFSGIDSISGGSLEGSGNSDTFVVTGLNALTANKIAFSSISSVDAKGGSDSVTGADGANWILTGTSKQASNSSITFSNVESLTAVNANLLGTSGTDAFVLQSGGDVAVYDLIVSGMSVVDGQGGDDSLNASAYSDGLTLTGTNNQVAAGSLTFDGIVSAVTAALTGTDNADSFVVDGSNAASSYGIAFSGLSTINALDGSDSVIGADGANWTLTGTSKQASNSSITFSNVESLTAVNANLLGTASVDAFTLQSNGDVAVYDLTVSGMSAVDGQGGDDSLNASAYSDGLTLTGTNNQVAAGSLTFDGIVSAVTAALTGTDNADSFVVDGSNAASSYGIAFSGLSTINALDGSDSVIGADGANWTLTGTSKQASNSSITFSNVESLTAVNANLLGTASVDAFTLQSNGDVAVYDLTVSGMSAVDGQGGDDSLNASAYSDGLTLTGTNNQVAAGSLTFDGIVSAVTAALTGTDNADSFVVDGSNAASSYGIAFSGLSTINALDGSDSVIGADGANWTLTGTSKQASNSSITFSNVESLTAVNANLLGTASVDAFTLQSNGDVAVYDLTVSGMSAVDGQGGDDSLNASAYSDGLTLTGTNNQVAAGSLTFDGIVSAVTAALTGTDNADSFVVDGSNAASSYGIAFSGLSTINALDGSDSVIGADGANWTLTGTSKQASNSSITFSNVESLTAVNANLLGTASVDAFTLQSNGDVAVYDLTVSGMSAVDGQGGDDSLNASAYSDGLTLTGTNNQVAAGSLTFDGIVSAVTAALTGTDNADSFVVDGSNAASSYGIAFSGLSTINALDGSDSVIGADGANWTLTGTSKQASNSSITFSNVESLTAVNANLLGTASVDAFTLQSNGDVAVYDLTVSGMSAVDGQGGDDSLNASAYSDGLTLTGTNNQVAAGSLTFDGIVSAVTAALTGTDNADSFVVDGSNAASSYGIAFSGLSTINALDGSDSVIGADGANWTLTGTSKQASNSSITFSNVESLTAVNANLLGTASVDAFTLQSNGDVAVYDLTVSGMSVVDGQGGDDSLNASAYSDGLTLTGTNNQVAAGSLTFDGIVSAVTAALTGTDNADSFVVDGSNAASSYGIAFSGLSTINALDGSDSVIGADGANWTLTGTSKQASNSSITFSNVESLTAVNANLLGTASVDAFTLQSNGDVAVYDLIVSGMSVVDGQGGDDSLNASAYSDGLTLTGTNNQVAAGSLTFDGIVSAVTAALTGTDNADSFVVDGSNAASSYGIAFSGLSTINALDGSDSVIGTDGANWILTGTSKQASNSNITFSNVESLTAVNANLLGTASVDAFTLQSNGDVAVYDLTVSGMSVVDGQGGDDSLNASAYSDGLTLTGTNNQVAAGSLTFDGIVSAVTAALTGTDNADSFVVDGSNAASSYGIAFSGLSTINALDGSDSVIGADGANWILTGSSKQASNSSITFSNVESLTAVNASLLGSSGADAFILQSDGDVEAYSMVVSGMSAVDGQGGNNSLDAVSFADGLALTGADNQVSAGSLIFDGIFTALTGTLFGTSNADNFVVDGSNAVTSYGIAFSGVGSVDAQGGSDNVVGASGADWVLAGSNFEATNSSISFSGVETLTVNNADLLGTGNADAFTLVSDGDVEVYGMTITGMSAVDGNGGDDSLDASTYSDGLALTETENQLVAGSLIFSGIFSANTPVLTNTNDSALFELQGAQALKTAGINFSGLETVNTTGAGSLLLGTEDNDDFVLGSTGDISVAGIDFTGLETIDGAGGNDSVSSDGAVWTSTSSNNSLVNGGAEALVNSLTVVFENLELVQGAGTYVGQDVNGEYLFSALDTMTIGGVTFEGLESLTAGSGSDVIYGADIDAEWNISDSQQSVSSAGETLIFSGVESIFAGGGGDQFKLSGGTLTEIDTGAGNDSVLLAGTTISTVSLGAGDDYVQVDADSAQNTQLSGGSGNDSFQYNLSGATWQINSNGNLVGNFIFDGFEYLDNTDGSLTLETDLGFDFVNGGDNSSNFNLDGAGLIFADSGMRLGYDGEGDINITSSSSDTIGGSLKASRAELTVAGDVNIEVEVNTLAIATSGADINISVLSQGDLVIDEINAGRGNVELASSNFGALTAETYGDTHITASTVKLGTDTKLWTIIGESVNPLRLDVSDTLDIYSVSYYEPDFIGQVPTVTSTGDELQSIAGSQASQGLKSAVQNAVEDFTQVDPAIFSAVKPYSSGVDAVNSPEMRLKSGELLPSTVSAGGEPVPGSEFDAVLDEGVSEAPADVVGEIVPLAGSAGG
ncbi:filamentous hemagglutinin N-terminal domain-containing protein [Microbulbifer sp. MLAF003]|uniref:filamentous hemagglutinin N-terminal domain-containing protein n=1 Tax=Microbulbifer sp. MLAF003 TaxID=3032582 RepID=UPI0024ACDD90|nr:filamentous hemagglutinin N-terminal domain-containing protein [Microbulbifer sp. MLAF003]WHI50965.1 filamentous hemagglutinin N-terminal domain-containing protein [Microbulbifer sp. MLAF003]